MNGKVSTVFSGNYGKPQAGPSKERLRVAIVTATMHAAGAEKQAFYMARALVQAGVDVRIYSLVRGGEYEQALRSWNVPCTYFGQIPGWPLRLLLLVAALRKFRPHVIQSVHAYMNVYSAIAARVLGAISVGGLRSDLAACLADNGRFSRYLLAWPDVLVANSKKAVEDVKQARLRDPSRVYFLRNVIDLASYPERSPSVKHAVEADCTCICVSRLFASKRVDVFVRALAAARAEEPRIRGVVVGPGPEEMRLRQLAAELGLGPDALSFLGFRNDVAALLQAAGVFVFCSESEGTPNVVLEAMAASLPVITTPAGDAAEVVEPAGAGYVVPFGDVKATANAMVWLARSPALRSKLGGAARSYIARHAATSELAGRLMRIYAESALMCERRCRADLLERVAR